MTTEGITPSDLNLELGEKTMKKLPVLVATVCDQMERLRRAIEVLHGKRVSFIRLDFNTREGLVNLGDEQISAGDSDNKIDIDFEFDKDGSLHLVLNTYGWCSSFGATFNDNGKVVSVVSHPVNAPEPTTRWVGSSDTIRHKEPINK